MPKETKHQVSECASMERKSMRGSSFNEFEILGIANSARWIGYELKTVIAGRKVYNRIIIRRRKDNHENHST
jgi:hypothetical protein